MLKVLIVDDEPHICSMINHLIDWDGLGLEPAGTAGNGFDAERLIEEKRPDIVIIDIRIPGMTGLELIERFSGRTDAPNFIVVSGYREFEYAQKALRFGVGDYLLKPIRQTDLNHALERLVSLRNSKERENADRKALVDELQNRAALLRASRLQDFIGAPAGGLPADGFDFKDGELFFLILHISFRDASGITPELCRQIFSISASRFLRSLNPDSWETDYCVSGTFCYFLVNFSPEKHVPFNEKCNYIQNIQNELNVRFEPTVISASVSQPVGSADGLPAALAQAKERMGLRIVLGPDKLINQGRERTLTGAADNRVTPEEKRQLSGFISALNAADSVSLIRRIADREAASPSLASGRLYESAREGVLILQRTLSEADQDFADAISEFSAKNDALFTDIENCVGVQQLAGVVCGEVQAEIGACISLRAEKDARPVRIVKQYVKEHIDRQILLDDIAPRAYVSAEYLGILFKQETGVTFQSYVIQARMEAAKKMLENGELSVSDIAERVGYSDSRHFSKVFQKMYGVNPTVYRRFFC